MLAKKTIFIVPGYRHSPTNRTYKKIADMLKSEGYEPILITIPWKQTTISENTTYFLKQYKKINTKKKYILGFSFGAMIAFLASTKVEVSGLILCSLSPYFQEDLQNKTFHVISPIQTARYQDFLQLHCASLAKKVKAKQILMVYGSKEARPLIRRVNAAFGQISSTQKHLFSVKEVTHDIGDPRYLNKIYQIAKVLH